MKKVAIHSHQIQSSINVDAKHTNSLASCYYGLHIDAPVPARIAPAPSPTTG